VTSTKFALAMGGLLYHRLDARGNLGVSC
jgi:hypothetical protein